MHNGFFRQDRRSVKPHLHSVSGVYIPGQVEKEKTDLLNKLKTFVFGQVEA